MSFFIDLTLPEAALLPKAEGEIMSQHPHESGAVWYHADGPSCPVNADGAVQQWIPDQHLGEIASPVKPNENNLLLDKTGALRFQSGLNCGLVLEAALIEPEQFTLAVRYRASQGEARSLLTVNPRDHEHYLFLSEKDHHLTWKRQESQNGLSLPSSGAGTFWAVVGYDHGDLSLLCAPSGQVFHTLERLEAPEIHTEFSGIHDIFIGCRSHRKGIKKTLGKSEVLDILLWVDQDMTRSELALLNASCRYCENQGGGNEL